MRLSILFGGRAGQGPNVIATIISKILVERGCYVFLSREYESLIRGGHNYNILTVSDKEIYSNDIKYDVLIALDDKTITVHKGELNKGCIIISEKKGNMYFAGRLMKILGLEFDLLKKELKELGNFEGNLEDAKEGYLQGEKVYDFKLRKNKDGFFTGSRKIAEGAVKSGLDLYYAYPMTPATPVLSELAGMQEEHNFLAIELENEISVINTALGSAMTGAKSMVGTSGGGYDLMTEALSMSGISEIPLVVYLAQRPGPASGVATKTGQGDLNIARYGGHGEFPRVVVAPGDPIEAEEVVSQLFYLTQKYKFPGILLGDKHLSESFYTMKENAKITKSGKLTKFKRYNSYEHLPDGTYTEDPKEVERMVKLRIEKFTTIKKDVERFQMYKVYGKQNSKNVIVSWGSTKGAILDATKELNCKFIHILYLEPFPEKIKKELKGKNVIVVENNATSPLSSLISEKTQILVKNKILKYNGQPFYKEELMKEIKRKLK